MKTFRTAFLLSLVTITASSCAAHTDEEPGEAVATTASGLTRGVYDENIVGGGRGTRGAQANCPSWIYKPDSTTQNGIRFRSTALCKEVKDFVAQNDVYFFPPGRAPDRYSFACVGAGGQSIIAMRSTASGTEIDQNLAHELHHILADDHRNWGSMSASSKNFAENSADNFERVCRKLSPTDCVYSPCGDAPEGMSSPQSGSGTGSVGPGTCGPYHFCRGQLLTHSECVNDCGGLWDYPYCFLC